MKKLLLWLLDLKIAELTMFRIFTIGLCVYAVVLIVYDVWVTIHPSPKAQPLYVLPFGAFAFAALCEAFRRHALKHPVDR